MGFMTGIKAVIFDLDGTLYEDDTVCFDLIRYFAEGTAYGPLSEEIVERAKSVLSGRENIKLGSFAVKENAREPASVENLFDFPVFRGLGGPDTEKYFDRSVYSYLGDGWTLAMFLAHRMGFYGEEFWKRFYKARRRLLDGPGKAKEDLRITEMLNRLRRAGIILMLCTNSTHDNSSELLKNLNLIDKFDELIHSAKKPHGLEDRIRLLKKNYSLNDQEILLAGDQGYSDLYPGYVVGAKTLLTNPYVVDDGMDWTGRAYSIKEFTELLTNGLIEKEMEYHG